MKWFFFFSVIVIMLFLSIGPSGLCYKTNCVSGIICITWMLNVTGLFSLEINIRSIVWQFLNRRFKKKNHLIFGGKHCWIHMFNELDEKGKKNPNGKLSHNFLHITYVVVLLLWWDLIVHVWFLKRINFEKKFH